ncbi:LAME_0D09472g1_1 [Lachancea meyersii CBS 8951]|uniref:LAME_0D09472g1_1 n=1 Tax=Lachancea meyersii CBS 8951 TaxID=1266667 RepID=A0A1G4JB68_9SACH|nr:LAME_0D09472g1_1 [Lachancea meyersii CBS 8951]
MSHSIIVSNVPEDVSDGSVDRFIREMAGDAAVVHMQPFPDQYHYVNDSNGTKTMQVFFATASEAHSANLLFQSPHIEEDLERAQQSFHGSSISNSDASVPRTMSKMDTWVEETPNEGVRTTKRRISVTMI